MINKKGNEREIKREEGDGEYTPIPSLQFSIKTEMLVDYSKYKGIPPDEKQREHGKQYMPGLRLEFRSEETEERGGMGFIALEWWAALMSLSPPINCCCCPLEGGRIPFLSYDFVFFCRLMGGGVK